MIYVIENLLEIFIAYAMICMGKDYAQQQNPRWMDVAFVVTALTIFYLDSIYTLKGGSAREGMYIAGMIILNAVPVVLLAFFGMRYRKAGYVLRKHQATDIYIRIYTLVVIMLCLIATASIIDSRTAKDLIWCDKEIYVIFWIIFNVLNFTFVWRSYIADERDELERIQTTGERMDLVARQYGLSARER